MMDRWLQGLREVGETLLLHPGSTAERVVVVIVSLLVGYGVLGKTGAAFGFRETGSGRTMTMLGLGLLLLLAALAALQVLRPAAAGWMWGAVGAGLALAVILPLMCLLLKGNYVVAFMTGAITAASLAATIFLVSAAFDAFAAGGKTAVTGSATHKNDLKEVIGKGK